MTTQDPNAPVTSGEQDGVWSGEDANTPGSQDTELVVGHGGPTSHEADLVDSSYTDGATVDTAGIYQSPGYDLGDEEDDVTNPSNIAPNTNSGQSGIPYANYDGTTNGATSQDAQVVPGDTEFAFGHGYDAATDNNDAIPPQQPGAKQPDIEAGTWYIADPDADANGMNGFLDTNPWGTGFPDDGVGGQSGAEVGVNTGLYADFYGQTNSDSQVLDTTNTSNPTALPANDGTDIVLSAVDLLGGTSHVYDSTNIDGAYQGLTVGDGVSDPGAPTAVSWTFLANSAEVTWTAPASAGGGHIREYVVYGWRVRDASYLPANDAAADAYLTNGVLPTVTAHSRGVTKYAADGTTTVEVPQTRVRVEHLEPGAYYFFRVAARNETGTGVLSAITGVTYPTAPPIPTYYLSAVDINNDPITVPGGTDPMGESLAQMTFANNAGLDDDGDDLTGQTAGQLAGPGEEGEDRI